MANWLDKVSSSSKGLRTSAQLPALGRKRPVAEYGRPSPAEASKIPNASLIYGLGATVMMVMSLFFMFEGQWVTSLVILFPAVCLFGYAMYFVRYTNR